MTATIPRPEELWDDLTPEAKFKYAREYHRNRWLKNAVAVVSSGLFPWMLAAGCWGIILHQPTNSLIKSVLANEFSFGELMGQKAESRTGDVVADAAKKWAGKDFKPGEVARCADFVRAVLAESGIEVGVTAQPVDGHTPNPFTANSFFGNDLGQLIKDKSQLQPGDIVMFQNTYGSFPEGTVTHVGIYVGNGMMVDRPTASKPVQQRSIDTFPRFAGALRPGTYKQPKPKAEALSEAEIKCTVGAAEGTRDAKCQPTKAYGGHVDPGNGAWNKGTFSYQHGASNPEEADHKWLPVLKEAGEKLQQKSTEKFGKPLSKAALAAGIDAYNQSPKAGLDFVANLPTFDPTPEQIITARSKSFVDPATGKLQAPGLGNDWAKVQADQQRRVNAILEQLK